MAQEISGIPGDGILGDPAMHTEPTPEPVDGIPADIADAVDTVANRYGVEGLQQLVEAAQARVRVAEASLRELGDG